MSMSPATLILWSNGHLLVRLISTAYGETRPASAGGAAAWWIAASIDTRQAFFDACGVRRGCTSAETAKTSTLYEAGAVMP
jgi:hypothetical protein